MSLIEQLADMVGLHSSYTGAFGEQVLTKASARHTLLTVMGFELDDKSLVKTIDRLNKSPWINALPILHIAKLEEKEHTIRISLPIVKNQVAKQILHWKITPECENELGSKLKRESGSDIIGSIDVSNLHFVDTIQLGETQYCQYLLPLPVLEQGYHQLQINFANTQASCPLIFAPKMCYRPQEAAVNKMWGYTAQLYSLRSNSNWGIGDFTDLFTLVEKSAEQQASTIGLNPLHPLFQRNPAHRSPYSPSSRSFLNPLYIDVSKIPNFLLCDAVQKKVKNKTFQQKIARANNSKLVDYPAVAKLKYEITEMLFDDFWHKKGISYQIMSAEFNEFKQKHGANLYQFATFDALNEHFNLTDKNVYGWPDWPKNFQNPSSEEVLKFQHSHITRIEYFCFLQWIADQQLSAVARCAADNEMALGLYLDLAVGCDGGGVDVWSEQEVYVTGAAIGAPPDGMNPLGQNWGLTPINPVALKNKAYQPLIKALRSNMQYAGALRIDHILGLMRQYWVAPGMDVNEGVYISFPFDDILRIVALESQRNHCVVIGEDLGNVPEGFSETIQDAGLLSFKVMFFERWPSGLFKRPENFPTQSIVTVATHDTSTLSGWWQGRDLEWRQQLNLYVNDAVGHADRNARASERKNLIAALDDLHVIDMSKAPQQDPAVMNTELSIAVQKYLAASPSHIQLIPLEDALEIPEQVNIPGTIDQHPNWLQKLPVLLEDFWQTDTVKGIAQAMRVARPN
ncbi:MAG: 4-alpha-glucanotransferase [Alteromonadaceae bacterium]|jgi:4-alpha-glucanotransferase